MGSAMNRHASSEPRQTKRLSARLHCVNDVVSSTTVTPTCHRHLFSAERQAQQPGPLRNLWLTKNLHAAPVCCSAWFGLCPRTPGQPNPPRDTGLVPAVGVSAPPPQPPPRPNRPAPHDSSPD